jgi:hypothetical protein
VLERTQLFAATTLRVPPRIAHWARTSPKREQAGIKGQLRRRAGDGGIDRGMVTGAKGTDNPDFGALLDLGRAAAGQRYLFDTGYRTLATSEAIREHGSELVTLFHDSIAGEVVEERPVPTPETAQGYPLQSDRLVRLGTGKPRSPPLWRLLDATDPQGQRRTILTSLLEERAGRITQLRAYRWAIAMVCRWLTRVLPLAALRRVSPAGIARQVAVALIVSGVVLLYQAGGALSLKARQRRVTTELPGASFAAGVAEGARRARARAAPAPSAPLRLRAVGEL